MIDPRVSENIKKSLDKNSIIVFDEAHNIDDVCIEAYSVKLNRSLLEAATKN